VSVSVCVGVDANANVCTFCSSSDAASSKFDTIVGHLQDVAISPEFQGLRDGFCDRHCEVFEDTEENKLEYMIAFKEWTSSVEVFLASNLEARMPGFKMAAFVGELTGRQDQIDPELFEMLRSLGDFLAFKQEMLEYKEAKAFEATGGMMGAGPMDAAADGGFGLVVHSMGAR